jgi:dTDP-4-amino-4,6-dideoxygalactose transaminase
VARHRKLLRFQRPWLPPAELEAIVEKVATRAESAHHLITEFETAFAAYVQSSYAVATVSCVAALALAVDTLALQPDDEVILSVCASAATVTLLLDRGARPILVDVGPGTLTMDPEQVERRITERTRALMAVHTAGFPCDMARIMRLAAAHRLRVLEDAGDAIPAWHGGQKIGCIGDLTVFRFDPIPPFVPEGLGVVTTDRDDHRRRLLAVLGGGARGAGGAPVRPRISTLRAAIALERLRRADLLYGIRRYFADIYDLGLSDLPALRLPSAHLDGAEPAWTHYPIQLDVERLGMNAETFVGALREQRVEAIRLPAPLADPGPNAHWRDRVVDTGAGFPNATAAHAATVLVPLDAGMTEVDVWDVVNAIRRIIDHPGYEGAESPVAETPPTPPSRLAGGARRIFGCAVNPGEVGGRGIADWKPA